MELKINIHERQFSVSYSEEIKEEIALGEIFETELFEMVERCVEQVEAVPFGEYFILQGQRSVLAMKRVGDIHLESILKVML